MRIYHDARSPERQILYNVHYNTLHIHNAFRASFYLLSKKKRTFGLGLKLNGVEHRSPTAENEELQ